MPPLPATVHWPAAVVPLLTTLGTVWVLSRVSPGRLGRRPVVLVGTGLLLLAVALVGPLDWIAERRLLSAHMVQHIVVMSLAPSLILAGLFAARELPSERRNGRARVAAGCLVGAVGVIWILHSPPVFDAAMRSPVASDLHHLPLLAAGLALAWPLLDPSGVVTGFGGPIYLVLAEIGLGLLGMWLAWFPGLVYETYRNAPSMLGLRRESDQSLAGAILLVVEEPLLAAEFAILFIRALGDEEDDED